jgi:2-oxoglutarate dehydrogenase E2 component (dihydrolipoamide succinyltransferase)
VILAVLVKEGELVKVGALLGWIGQPGETIPQEVAPEQPATVSPLTQTTTLPTSPPHELGFISPVVAKIAAEQNVDLSNVPGTGMGGRITKKDIEAYLDARKQAPPPTTQAALTPVIAAPTISTFTGTYTVVPQTPMRKAIAEHMLMSEHTAPHVSTIMEVDMTRVVAHRNANKEAYALQGVNLTYTAYFVIASVTALKAYSLVNSSWSEQGVRIYNTINIGMATALGDEGLIVPVIRDAENLSLLGVARIVNDLSNRARAHKLQPNEVKGGTFTITNHGVSGSLFATPIINQPQCAILGVGVIQKRPIVITDVIQGDVLAIRPMMYLSLTFDHRIIDGAIADYFLARVVNTLQEWT